MRCTAAGRSTTCPPGYRTNKTDAAPARTKRRDIGIPDVPCTAGLHSPVRNRETATPLRTRTQTRRPHLRWQKTEQSKTEMCCGRETWFPARQHISIPVLIGELVHLIVVEIIETEDEVVILFPPRFQQLRRSIRRSMVEAFLRRLDILFQFCPCTHNTRFSQRRRKKDTNLPVLLRMSDGQLPERCLRKAGHRPARRSRACLPPQKAACRQLREQGAAQSSASSSIRALR